jgi:large conductance mechanosensitive channel
MSLLKEFKSFAMRGNVVDMAVGIIIGAAFGKIISSLVNDILMPPIGVLIGGMDFSSLGITIKEAAADHAAVVIKYGMFINILIDFLIVAFAMFIIIQAMNRLMQKPEVAPANPTTKECPECLMVIPINAKRCGHCTSALK